MPGALTATVDFSRFNAQVERYITQLHMDAPEVIRTQARLFLQQALKFTPPKTKAQGESAIKGDLFGKRSEIVNGKWTKSHVPIFLASDAALERGEYEIWRIDRGTPMVIDRELYRPHPSIAEMKKHHYANRSKFTGRTSNAGGWGKEIGRWKSHNIFFTQREHLTAYFKHTAAKVGRLKAGWAPAIAKLGGNVPAWVKRHIGGARGYVQLDLAAKDHPSITIENHAAGSGKLAHHVSGAMQVRIKSMMKDIRVKLGEARRIF